MTYFAENAEEHDYNKVSRILSAQAKKTPENVAVFTGKRTLTYGELEDLVQRCTSRMYGLGLANQSVCALAFGDELTLLIACLGLNRLNVGVACFSIRRPIRDTEGLMEGCSIDVILSDQEFSWGDVENIQVTLADIEQSSITSIDEAELRNNKWEMVFLGSGSTGRPKLIAYEFGTIGRQIIGFGSTVECDQDNRFFSFVPMQYGTTISSYLYYFSAGASVLLPYSSVKDHFRLLEHFEISHTYSTVFHAEVLCRLAEGHGRKLEKLRDLSLSSSVVTNDLVSRLNETVTDNVSIYYDTNECWPVCSIEPGVEVRPDGSVGKVIQGAQVQIVDEHDNEVAPGTAGTVRMRSYGMFCEYIGQPDVTRQSLRNGWFYPGDTARMNEDGHVILLGRSDHMMIFNGINIYPAEIENTMAEHHGVRDVAVMPMKHSVHQDVPVCAVSLHADQQVSETELMEFGREQLGSRSAKYVFVVDEIPRNLFGKLIRTSLAKALEPGMKALSER